MTRVSKGDHVAWFLAKYCVHVKGRWAQNSDPVVVEDWQLEFLREAFEVDPKTNRRIYTEVVLGIPRKNGKSLCAAGLGHYLLTMDGEAGPEVISAAGSKDQARIVHDVARRMATKSPGLNAVTKVLRNSIICPGNDGVWTVVSSDADLQQGTNPHGAIIDELHVHKTDALYNALAAGTGARENPLLITITTAGNSLASPLGTIYQAALKLSEVQQPNPYLTICRDKTNGFLMYWFGLGEDAPDDISNPKIMDGCNPASWITPEFLTKQLGKPTMRELDFRRFHLNQWCENSGAGLDPKHWDAMLLPGCDIPEGSSICIGVDASYREDPSAVVWGSVLGDKIHIKAAVFDPPDDKNLELDISATVDRTVIGLFEKYRVDKIRCDKFLIRTLMQEWSRRGWPVEDFPMWDSSMCPASASLLEAVNLGMLQHDGDKVLRGHVLNMRMKDTNRAWRFDRYDRDMPIDAGIALIMCVDALRTNEGNVYETRGVFVL